MLVCYISENFRGTDINSFAKYARKLILKLVEFMFYNKNR